MLLYHPEFARSCEDCSKWMYDDDGRVARRPARVGLPVLRPKGTPTPCWKCPKIPDDAELKTRQFAQEMTEQSVEFWLFYLECKAVGDFPKDDIVRRMAGVCRHVEDAYDRNALAGRLESLIVALIGRAARG